MVRVIEPSSFEIFLAVVDAEAVNPISPLKLDLVNKKSFQGDHNIGQFVLMIVIHEKSIVPQDEKACLHD